MYIFDPKYHTFYNKEVDKLIDDLPEQIKIKYVFEEAQRIIKNTVLQKKIRRKAEGTFERILIAHNNFDTKGLKKIRENLSQRELGNNVYCALKICCSENIDKIFLFILFNFISCKKIIETRQQRKENVVRDLLELVNQYQERLRISSSVLEDILFC